MAGAFSVSARSERVERAGHVLGAPRVTHHGERRPESAEISHVGGFSAKI